VVVVVAAAAAAGDARRAGLCLDLAKMLGRQRLTSRL
jgi:hypothetical protein